MPLYETIINTIMEIISIEQAKVGGLVYYFTGKPCKYGHIDKRTISRRMCMECIRIRSREWNRDHPDKRKFFSNRNYQNNRVILISKSVERKINQKMKAIEYKGGKCQICGYNKCHGALEFHHRDPSEKDFTIAKICARKWEFLKQELDKCDLLCSNCHREVHEKQHYASLGE
jgi:hypothetical protein